MGEKETGARAALPIFREIMLRVYRDRLAGPVPPFPLDIEQRIDAYLAMEWLREAGFDGPLTGLGDGWTSQSTPLAGGTTRGPLEDSHGLQERR